MQQSYQKAIEQCTKQFSTTIFSLSFLESAAHIGVSLPPLALLDPLLQLHPPPPLLTAESRGLIFPDFPLMNMARLAAANDEDRPPSLENEVIKVINVWVN